MTEQLREQAQWRKAKTPIIEQYLDDHAKLMAEIAGRGFLSAPGYAYDIENGLELTAKASLSEINQKILAETIERELKQVGVDYNQAYINAGMVWEIEKQALVIAWDSEFAGIKQQEAGDEEVLNLLAIEVGQRSITLLEAKTAIEEDMEALRKDMAELDGTVSPYEVQLANAKLLTAQRKLLVIPILQEIIVKEQELLVKEQEKAAAATAYISAEREIAAKKATLAPFVNELASLSGQHAAKITTEQIPKEELISGERVKQAAAAGTKAGYQVDEITTEIEIETKNLDLMDAKRALQASQFDSEQSIVTTENYLTAAYQEDQQTSFDSLLATEKNAAAKIISEKTTVHDTKSSTQITHVSTIADAEMSAATGLANLDVSRIERETDLKVMKEITASLKHLIG
ncbi:MAG: hypothetical protein WAZ60_23970 [Desulfosalsimonadaceae bacterium]